MKLLFFNNHEFCELGWATKMEYQSELFESFERIGIEFKVFEVMNPQNIEDIASKNQYDLVMSNMYYVRDSDNNLLWLSEVLEGLKLPYLGSSADSLISMINKDITQTILNENNITVPNFIVVNSKNYKETNQLLDEKNLKLPVIVKPCTTAGSEGLSKKSVKNSYEDVEVQAKHIIDKYGGKAIIEEFIDGEEVTVGILKNGTERTTLKTFSDNYLRLTDSSVSNGYHKARMQKVTNQELNNSLDLLADRVFDALGIYDITRFDCMMDKSGDLSVIDVNGMPGLSMNGSYTTRQVYTCYPELEISNAYDKLIATILYFAAKRNNINNHRIPKDSLLPLSKIK